MLPSRESPPSLLLRVSGSANISELAALLREGEVEFLDCGLADSSGRLPIDLRGAVSSGCGDESLLCSALANGFNEFRVIVGRLGTHREKPPTAGAGDCCDGDADAAIIVDAKGDDVVKQCFPAVVGSQNRRTKPGQRGCCLNRPPLIGV